MRLSLRRVVISVLCSLAMGCLAAGQENPVAKQTQCSSGSVGPTLHLTDLSLAGTSCLGSQGSQCLTCRSFLFRWPGQSNRDLQIDLCEPLVTDRPDFTEASSTVGRGVTQFELGYSYYSDQANGGRTDLHSYPEVLMRAGLLRDWFEVRIAYNSGSLIEETITNSGSEDLYIGAKIGLTAQKGWLPEMAILPQATLDTGSPEFTNGTALFGTNWLYSWEINDYLSLAGSTQFNRAVDGGTDDLYTQWAQSIALGASLTECVGSYFEWFAFFPDNADTDGVEHYLNGGFTYLQTNNVQWDIRAGLGLNDRSQDFLCGAGLSVRFH